MGVYIFIALVAFLVSGLTLFAGFGLGTLLMPAFALFFPVGVAVAATAVVHFLNNLFKVALLYKHAAPAVLVRFGLPAVVAALLGAALLTRLSQQPPLLQWTLAGREAIVTPIKLVMGGLILIFAIVDLAPGTRRLRFDEKWIPLGGTISGFFGGLSGHQGALRAAFLLPLGLEPSAFAATQAVLASMVDASRLVIYGLGALSGKMSGVETAEQWSLVLVATLAAFAGALLGKSLLPKMTIGALRWLTGSLLLIVGVGLASGLI